MGENLNESSFKPPFKIITLQGCLDRLWVIATGESDSKSDLYSNSKMHIVNDIGIFLNSLKRYIQCSRRY